MDGEIFTPKNGSVGKMIFGQKTDQFQTSHEMDIYSPLDCSNMSQNYGKLGHAQII